MRAIVSAAFLAFAIGVTGASAQAPKPKDKMEQTRKKEPKAPGKKQEAPGKGQQPPGKGQQAPDKGPTPPENGKKQSWKNGQKLPAPKTYQDIHNYKKLGLKPPAKGQRWVMVDGQYLLIVSATGVILSVIAGH